MILWLVFCFFGDTLEPVVMFLLSFYVLAESGTLLSMVCSPLLCCRLCELRYPIYMGPQQQEEPDGRGDGWWPATNPLVSFRNISIFNATFENVIWPQAGVLRCNASNPCLNIVLDRVSISGWNATEWVCEHSIGQAIDTMPVPQCLGNSTRKG